MVDAPNETVGLLVAGSYAADGGVHVASPAVPSATEVGLHFYPDSLYLVCSLAGDAPPEVRAWIIRNGEVGEVPLAVS